MSFLACTKVELWDLTVCIAVNDLDLDLTMPIIKLVQIFSYTTMYLNFMFLDKFLFELLCKHTHGHTQRL